MATVITVLNSQQLWLPALELYKADIVNNKLPKFLYPSLLNYQLLTILPEERSLSFAVYPLVCPLSYNAQSQICGLQDYVSLKTKEKDMSVRKEFVGKWGD